MPFALPAAGSRRPTPATAPPAAFRANLSSDERQGGLVDRRRGRIRNARVAGSQLHGPRFGAHGGGKRLVAFLAAQVGAGFVSQSSGHQAQAAVQAGRILLDRADGATADHGAAV